MLIPNPRAVRRIPVPADLTPEELLALERAIDRINLGEPIRIACLGCDHRIRPAGVGYDGPPGPLLMVSPPEWDERGKFQIIDYFQMLYFRVPPLTTWRGGYVARPNAFARQAARHAGIAIPLEPRFAIHGEQEEERYAR